MVPELREIQGFLVHPEADLRDLRDRDHPGTIIGNLQAVRLGHRRRSNSEDVGEEVLGIEYLD
jgi:hypothetical protein